MNDMTTKLPKTAELKSAPEQFMREANAQCRAVNEICKQLGIAPQPIPYPDVEKEVTP